MSPEENKAVILRLYDLINQKQLDAYYELYAPDFIDHASTGDRSLEQMKQFEAMATAAFPDAKFTVDNMVAEGDKVAFQVHCRMTHKGTFRGVAPTGKKIEVINTHIVKIVANKVMEWWGTMDNLGMMQQLGIVSLSGQK